eukprot:6020945-Pyramimonas_sp.AAC.1
MEISHAFGYFGTPFRSGCPFWRLRGLGGALRRLQRHRDRQGPQEHQHGPRQGPLGAQPAVHR